MLRLMSEEEAASKVCRDGLLKIPNDTKDYNVRAHERHLLLKLDTDLYSSLPICKNG